VSGRYHMDGLEPPDDPLIHVHDMCMTSDQLTERALDWLSTHAWEHTALVEHAVDYFVDSPEFATWMQDVADGEDTA